MKGCGDSTVPITRYGSGVCTSDWEVAWKDWKWLGKEPQK